MPAESSLIGRRYGRWKIIGITPPRISRGGYLVYLCIVRCDCGTIKTVYYSNLKNGCSQSCGCRHKELLRRRCIKHGQSKGGRRTRIFRIWTCMMQRCTNPSCPAFKRYGAAGITVCWGLKGLENFIRVLGECPPGLTIDRWPNKFGSYKCGCCAQCLDRGWSLNVRWATPKQQARNQKSNRVLTVRGVTACLSELCELFHAKYDRIKMRLNLGWSPERAFFAPSRMDH